MGTVCRACHLFPSPTPFYLREENPTETISHRTEGARGVCGPPERTAGLPEHFALCPAGLGGAHTGPRAGRPGRVASRCRSAPAVRGCRQRQRVMPRQQNCFPVGLVGPGASSRVRNVWFPPVLGTVRT